MQFPEYQSLESGSTGESGKAHRSIPDRIKEYHLETLIESSSDILDLGCNAGGFGKMLRPLVRSYTGVDHDSEAIALATESLKQYSNVELINEKINPDMKLGLFDLVLSLAVHAYADCDMKEYAKFLSSATMEGGYLALEGHPADYLGEPQVFWNPLTDELNRWFSLIHSSIVIDRGMKRTFNIYFKRLKQVAQTPVLIAESNKAAASVVYRHGVSIVEKRFRLDVQTRGDSAFRNHFEREKKAYGMLHGCEHFPVVLEAEEHKICPALWLSDCGNVVTKETLPYDWEQQCEMIQFELEIRDMFHNDIKLLNVCTKNGVLYLLDFGFCTYDKPGSPFLNDLKSVLEGL